MKSPPLRFTPTHVYFYGGPPSQWHMGSSFKVALPIVHRYEGGRRLVRSERVMSYNCAEQALMAAKASIFDDMPSLKKIMEVASPKKQKEFGREVFPFDEEVWSKLRPIVTTINNVAKFSQSDGLHTWLMSTEDRILVEGSMKDTIFGVGIDWADPRIEDERNWRGTNILGNSLMDAREIIRVHGRDVDPYTAVSALIKARTSEPRYK